MLLKAGSTFGRYRIDARLGEGGMAAVYRAWEGDLDRHVALKVLAAELARDKTFGERFNREAKMVAKLEHPNIIPIFAYGIQNGIPWMAMRLVGGGNLVSLAGGRPVPPRRAAAIVEGVADALDYAHARGIIHRDIKPQNILLDEEGRVYLVDFGIARMTEGAQRLTQAGMVAGTPHYMAPEQASAGKLDARVDIYALGVVAYELLTGVTPFRADEPMDVLMKHISDPVPIPQKGSVPPGVIEPLLTSLAKRPDDRFASARAFAAALKAGIGDGGRESEPSPDDFAPTIAMERPNFDDMHAAKERPYEPTVLAPRPVFRGGKGASSEAPAYEPTVLVARPTIPPPPSTSQEASRYEPTVFTARPVLPAASQTPKAASPDNSRLKTAAIVLVGFGLLLLVGTVAIYSWWNSRSATIAGTDEAPAATVAMGAPASLPPPPEPQAAAETPEAPAANAPAEPAPASAGQTPAAQAPAPAARPTQPPPPRPAVTRTARPTAAPAATAVTEPEPEPASKPKAPAVEAGDQEPAKETAPLEAVPEASRSWTTVRDVDRTVPLQLERSVDLGVRVSGVPVDRVFITAKDARSGIKKIFRKNTDKLRFTAEFLLNCPKDGSRPKLIFDVELQRAEGGVLERLSEKKNCEGHIKVSRDVATSLLSDAQKVRIRVRPPD